MTARYREIAGQLRQEIETGRYAPGALLPGIADLAARFQASRVTVRTAVRLLEDAALVRVVQGRGTEVVDHRVLPVRVSRYAAALRTDGARGPWATACEQAGVAGVMRLVDVERQPAPADVAEALGLDLAAPVVRRDRHATIEGQAVQLQSAWYPLDLVAATALAGDSGIFGGIYAVLVAAGLQLAAADEAVTARAATTEEAAELRIREGAPVLVVERLTRAAGGRAVELLRVVANPSRTRLVYDDMPIG